MVLERTTLQNLFLFIVALCVSINASNSNLLIQFSSINFIIFFFLCLKNKDVLEAIKENYISNKSFFIIFIVYIGYLIFQIIPLPLHWFEIIAPANHTLYSSIKIDKEFWSISLDPSNSYFRILNCINFFIIFLIFPALFFKHKKKKIIKFIEENWISKLLLLAFMLTHNVTINKNKFCNKLRLKTIKYKHYLSSGLYTRGL